MSRHLINNADKIRKERKKGNIENTKEKNDSRENQSEQYIGNKNEEEGDSNSRSTTDQNDEVRT